MPQRAGEESLAHRIRWLVKVRWFAAAGLAALTLLVHFAAGLGLAWRAILVVTAVMAGYNLLCALALPYVEAGQTGASAEARLERFAFGQIGLDILALTTCLCLSGGVENPLVMIVVLPPIVASVLLSPARAYLLAGWTTVLFVAMAFGHAAWPSFHYAILGHPPVPLFRDRVFIVGRSLAMAVTVHVSVYLAGTIATRLRRHERELQEARDALETRTAELARTNQDLRALEEKKSRFLSLTAHQLRGPLAATEGCLACACDGYAASPAKQAHLLLRARTRVQGMLQLTRDLLTLAGAHELSVSSKKTRVIVDVLAERVVDQYVDYAASRQVDLVFHPGAPGAEVAGDERALLEVLSNLVSNAIKYSDEGGHVKVATRTHEGDVVCEVIDDGIGIPESEKARLFTEFFRAANAVSSGREGTGLGLSIVKEIVGKHGGRLRIESLEKLGTCVFVALPQAHRTSS